MLKIEWVVGSPTRYICELKGDVLLIDYAEWMALDKSTRKHLLETHVRDWKKMQTDKLALDTEQLKSMGATLYAQTANERRLNDALEDLFEGSLPDPMCGMPAETERTILMSTHEALIAEVKAELAKEVEGVKELGAEVAQWRNLARRLEKVWYESWNFTVFGSDSVPIMGQLIKLLNKTDGTKPDTARMSVPDSDDDFDWNKGVTLTEHAARKLAESEAKDHFIRAYNTETHEVVYWQEKWGWGTDRTKMRYFTRSKALEMANSTNATGDNDEIINVCAIQEIR